MAFRELSMIEVKELMRRYQAQESVRRSARETNTDRKTVRRYFEAAQELGITPTTEVTDAIVGQLAAKVQGRPAPPPSDQWRVLEPHRSQIEKWLSGDRPLRLVRIHELLGGDKMCSYSTLRRYAQRELGWGGPRVSVRLADTEPGEEAQVDFGHMGWLEIDGKRKKLWALIVTLSYSRYMFVWPVITQTVHDVCEGLDAAWNFFGGVPRRVIFDNASSMVTVPNAQEAQLQEAFHEYAQARGFFADPARVRSPQDKARVENAVAYVRERWADGSRFLDLADARRSAESWCHDVAGARVHGTTRQVPRDVYAAEERPRMLPPPSSRFDTPVWSTAKVHPDHHVQVARALYSVPTHYIGRVLRVRLDSMSVRIFDGSTLVKMHARMAPGRRSTDPADYPKTKSALALRDVNRLRATARERGRHVGDFADKLLGGPAPWQVIRQAQALVRLCDRYGDARVDAACERAISFEVYQVPRIERMLKAARASEETAASTGKVITLPAGRFARDLSVFSTRKGGAQ